jgi:hypothetical protein
MVRIKVLALFVASASLSVGMIFPSTARAGSVLYDFESLPIGGSTAYSVTAPGETQAITVHAADGSKLDVVDLSSVSGATPFGSRTLQLDASDSTAALVIDFPFSVTSVSAQIGHVGSDEFTPATLSLNAYDTTDRVPPAKASANDSLAGIAGLFNFKTLTVDSSGIRSVELLGTEGGFNTAFFDNIAITTGSTPSTPQPVPLPPAVAMFPAAAMLMFFVARKMRRAPQN